MVYNPNPSRRLTGKLVILGALAIALPLTATRAIELVDVQAPTPPTPPSPPVAGIAPVAPLAPIAPLPAAAPVAPLPPLPPVPPSRNGKVWIDGKEVDWKNVSPEEGNRASLPDEARRGRATTSTAERARRIAEAMTDMKKDRLNAPRTEAPARGREAMREIDRSAAVSRAGQDPEAMKATVRASLKAVEAIDIDASRAMPWPRSIPADRAQHCAAEALQGQAEIDAAERDN